jgi:hypothetical protein
MVICFNCTSETKEKLDRLLQKGGYQDYTGAISSAISNQLMLEEQIAQSGAVILHESSPPAPRPEGRGTNDSPSEHQSVFEAFALLTFQTTPTLAVSPESGTNGAVSPDQWIFGQYSKFLPVKANCRFIANLLHQSPSGVSLKGVAEAMQQHMPRLREWLTRYDGQHALERESALATAFPSKDTKSLLRYMNQFVLNVNKRGIASGFPVALGLLNSLDPKGTRISLTEAGLHFALLQNPVLDSPQQPEHRLSMEERGFLLDHIRAFVPREHAAYTSVIQAIQIGANNPDALDAALRPLDKEGISAPYLSTQRSGTISRMTELGLVARRRQGIRVTYVLTPEGRAYTNA